ncbi:MAG: toxin-antitoxin system HicB family antitoxin [Propionibacteriaceae bacterium]|jgi:predicted HicB family RNase H-like nuclease|nr:toxin-antitoxin system HicB family antitoxin [Propionibacteriaceae bacterium]
MSDVASHYSYRVHWSAEDDMFVGTVAELPSLSWLADEQVEAFTGIVRATQEAVADMEAAGEPVPEAFADREYSGKFLVRVPPEEHRRLVVDAAEQHVSLNRLAAVRLARV